MSDFSDRPFVAGSLIGLRAFSVDAMGRLTGPSFHSVFTPGENEATCGGGSFYGQMQADISRAFSRISSSSSYATTTYKVTSPLSIGEVEVKAPEPPPHVVAGVNCGCGYYAYFNGENTYAEKNRVSAIIEGYGVCTVGEKGFRASKAKLVALVLPDAQKKTHPAWFDRYADWLKSRDTGALIGIALMVFGIAIFATGMGLATSVNPAFAALSVLGVAVFLGFPLTLKADFHGIDRRHPTVSDVSRCRDLHRGVDFSTVRRNYPDVPVYGSLKAALAAHPLTPPQPDPLPTPDDDDFWTRAVPR